MKRIFPIFLIWLVGINVFGVIVLNRFNLRGDTAYTWIDPSKFSQAQGWDLTPLHARWDSFWYTDIAAHGYTFKGLHELSNIVFFPLYPLLIRLVAFLAGGNLVLAGWLVSIAALFMALFYFAKLVREFHPNVDPDLPLLFLLIFPTAFFLNTVYTESLFLFLSVASIYYGLKKNFLAAGLFGLCAALTRVTGILLFIPLAWEYITAYGVRDIVRKKFMPLLLVPLGTLGFFLYHYAAFGDFLLFFKVESWWGRAFTLNRDHFLLMSNPAVINFAADVLFVLVALAGTYLAFKKLRTSYGLYMLATLAVALSTGTLMSIGRYILVLFPLYIVLASIKNRTARYAWIFASLLLLGMYTTLFVNNYWAG
jgi:hypothetical protein